MQFNISVFIVIDMQSIILFVVYYLVLVYYYTLTKMYPVNHIKMKMKLQIMTSTC